MTRPKSVIVLREDACRQTYGPPERALIATLTAPVAPPQTVVTIAAHPETVIEVEVLISGWGGPRLDRQWLDWAPRLRAVFYGAGSLAPVMTPEAWQRGIIVTTASAANAVPVAEYTVSMIVLSLKGVWRQAQRMRELRTYPSREGVLGAYQRVIGLVSLGTVGRAVIERLRDTEARVLAYDPHVTRSEASALGVALVTLETLFEESDVVSVHTPHVADAVGMIRAEHLRRMKSDTTFINTSRGAVVDENALAAVAAGRPDLQFVLDVTQTMPPPRESPLYALPNVLLTPHLAGSIGQECRRMGRMMVEELARYVAGEPLRWQVCRESVEHSIHAAPAAAVGHLRFPNA